jgi:pimeloyl-ACP methyl ester carboxylesterase
VEDLRFPATHAPHRDTARRMLRRHPENATAHVRHLRHDAPGHPALVWLHGWGMGQPRLEAAVCRARWLYRRGLDVYLYVLPYHGPRRPAGTHLPVTVFPSADITRTNEGFLQAAWEVRALLARHRHLAGARGGVMGLSLGGYLAAVLASVAPELAFAIALAPVADVAALMWSNGEGTAERRRDEAAGVTFDRLCRSMAVHAPLARAPAVPPDRLLLVGALGDRLIPPEHTRALWRHWGRPALHWFPGSHLVHFGRRGYLHRVERFLQERGLLAGAALPAGEPRPALLEAGGRR